MLESYKLKEQLESTRRELTLALYRQDAATRVIARLIKERDEARAALSRLAPNAAQMEVEGEDEDSAPASLPSEYSDKVKENSSVLSKERKKRDIPDTLPSPSDLAKFNVVKSATTHKSSSPGIKCLDIHPENDNLLLTGGVDRALVLYDRSKGRKAGTCNGHEKPVTFVSFHPSERLVSASLDNTVKLWSKKGRSWKEDSSLDLQVPINTAVLHPLPDLLLTLGDGEWHISDLTNATPLLVKKKVEGAVSLDCHPDGMIFATGTDGSGIRIWNAISGENAANLEGHSGAVTALSFSENGYYLASAGKDAKLKIWDLRLPKEVFNMDLDGAVNTLSWDHSGKYLAAGVGSEVRVFHQEDKELEHVATWDQHSSDVTAIQFTKDSTFFASTSMDRTLKIYAKK